MRLAFAAASFIMLAAPAAAQEGRQTATEPASSRQTAGPAPGPSRRFDAHDLFGLEVAADPQISPDGRRVAYVRRSGDIMIDRMRPTIWLVDTASGEQAPLVAGPGSHFSPRWSPDGTRLAYISTAEGGAAQLYVRWLGSGEAVRITGLPHAPSSIAWSPDGKQLAYVMLVPSETPRLGRAPARPEGAQWAEPLQQINAVTFRADGEGFIRPGFRHLFVVPADGGAPRQLTFGDFHHDGPIDWSRDGTALYVSANRSPAWEREPAASEIYAVEVATAALRPLTTRNGPDMSPVVSPDGRSIAYLGYDDRPYGYTQSKLYVMDRDGTNSRPISGRLDRDVGGPVWAADGRSVYVSYDERGVVNVARIALDGSIRVVAEGLRGAGLDRPYAGGDYSVARDGTVAFTSGSATRPADVAISRGGAGRGLTDLNSDLLGHKELGRVVEFQTPSSADQRPIQAWLTLPPGHREGQRHPLILEIHGGPWQAYGPNFATDN
jgi:dipeptidyl aminopeptidase/acylaminoacyl peptidase